MFKTIEEGLEVYKKKIENMRSEDFKDLNQLLILKGMSQVLGLTTEEINKFLTEEKI